jgi:Transcriptional regulatory protein, C terminal
VTDTDGAEIEMSRCGSQAAAKAKQPAICTKHGHRRHRQHPVPLRFPCCPPAFSSRRLRLRAAVSARQRPAIEEAVDFGILGPLEVREGGRALDLGGPKQRALLAILLLNANRVVSRDGLIDALWDEEPTATAPKAVQVYVSQLRKLLGRERVLGNVLSRFVDVPLQITPGYFLPTRLSAWSLQNSVFQA